jgi:hypothetical protein
MQTFILCHDLPANRENGIYLTDSLVFGKKQISLNIAKKYNYALSLVKSDWFCLKHDNIKIETSEDVIEFKLKRHSNLGCAGIIGNSILAQNGEFITGIELFGAGQTKQLELDDKGEVKSDRIGRLLYWAGDHSKMATLAGNCLFFNRKAIENLIFDDNLNDYHFAETDMCLQLLSKHYDLDIIDISTVLGRREESENMYNYLSERDYLVKKWSEKIDFWPITKYTKFHD